MDWGRLLVTYYHPPYPNLSCLKVRTAVLLPGLHCLNLNLGVVQIT